MLQQSPSALLGLRGGSSKAGDGTPWKDACEEGSAYDEAGDLASAIACYTRGLACESIPTRGAVFLYHNRAVAQLNQGSFVEAGEDARACLAIFKGSEALNPEAEGTVPEAVQRLIAIAREADLRAAAAAAEQRREAFTQGNEHQEAGEWASAIECYTRGLASDSIPTQSAAMLYSNRAEALLKQGSFAKAGADARAGLAIFSSNESLGLEQGTALDFIEQLNSTAREADLGVAVEQAAASTSNVSMAIVGADSPLWTALRDLNTTQHISEGEVHVLPTDSDMRFLATVFLYDSITVFASGPGKRAFGAHVNTTTLLTSLAGIKARRLGGLESPGLILETMASAMQDAFRDVDPSLVTISLVGGHKNLDLLGALRETYYPKEEAMWRFSAVVRRCVPEP